MSLPNPCQIQEREVLAEYSRMASLLDKVANTTQRLSLAQPIILENLRPLERKMGLVLTLFKASMWAVLLQREEQYEQEEARRGQQEEDE